jgi:hypothetical protein
MPLPIPEPGLIINYEFLWREEKERGLDHGRKRRPCAIVVAAESEGDRISVLVAPITHSPPKLPGRGRTPAEGKAANWARLAARLDDRNGTQSIHLAWL